MAEDLDLEPGGDKPPEPQPDEKKKRGGGSRAGGGGRPSRENVSTELKSSITGGLGELAAWLEPRDEDLAATLKDSAPRIAEFLAVHAAKRAKVARGVKYVFARGGPFAALRAFGPLTRELSERLGARRERPVEDPAAEEGFGGEPSPVLPDA